MKTDLMNNFRSILDSLALIFGAHNFLTANGQSNTKINKQTIQFQKCSIPFESSFKGDSHSIHGKKLAISCKKSCIKWCWYFCQDGVLIFDKNVRVI